jgi:uncharacterized protein YukE
MKWLAALGFGFVLLSPPATADEPPRTDSDWPCRQAVSPVLTSAKIWSGPAIDKVGDWHADPSVRQLVERISPRDISAESGEAAIDAFVRTLGADRRQPVLLAFSGLLEETNRERAEVIARIKELAERQHKLAALIDRLTMELDAMPAQPQGERAASRDELQQRWSFTSRTYAEVQHTMRYACQVPVSLEARLQAYAHALERALP